MSDSLYLVRGNIVNKFLAKSKYLNGATVPLAKNRKDVLAMSKDEKSEYLVSDSYWGVKFDMYRNLYYRFGVRSRTLKDVYAFKRATAVIVVLDENFKMIGEMELPQELYIDMVFITQNGLHIANKKNYDKFDENSLTFDVFKVNR